MFQIFFNFWHDVKKWYFDVHFDVYLTESGRDATMLTPPLLLSFTVNTDHPRAREVLAGSGAQSGVAQVTIPISFQSQAAYSAG